MELKRAYCYVKRILKVISTGSQKVISQFKILNQLSGDVEYLSEIVLSRKEIGDL